MLTGSKTSVCPRGLQVQLEQRRNHRCHPTRSQQEEETGKHPLVQKIWAKRRVLYRPKRIQITQLMKFIEITRRNRIQIFSSIEYVRGQLKLKRKEVWGWVGAGDGVVRENLPTR